MERPRRTLCTPRIHLHGTRLGLGLALSLACGADEPPAATPTPAPASPSDEAPVPASDEAPAPEPAPKPAPVAAKKLELPAVGAPGPAFIGVEGRGVAKIDDGAVTLLADSPKSGTKLQLAGDGNLWVMDRVALHRLDGDRFTTVVANSYDAIDNSFEAFTVTPEGDIWAATFNSVHHLKDGSWDARGGMKLAEGDTETIHGIMHDRGGHVFAASTNKLHVFDGAAWAEVDLGKAKPRDPFFNALVPGPQFAKTYLVSAFAILEIAEGGAAVRKVKVGGGSHLSVAGDGSLAVADFDKLHVVDADGKRRSPRPKLGSGAIAVADGGTLWVLNRAGVTVIPREGEATEWPSGSIPEIAGATFGVVVLGAGPARLPGAGPIRKGSLTGRLLRDGQPMPGLAVELCPSPSLVMYGKTPCDGASVRLKATSDDAGRWRFDEVPLGDYGIAVKVDGAWQLTLGLSLSNDMNEGELHDAGDLVLRRSEKK
ncbi:MAG: hypothetical protein R3A79_01570 [Nannocystaceae bacterium]